MAYKAKIKNLKTGEISKDFVDAIEAKELDDNHEYVCGGRVAGRLCLACFGSRACCKESEKKISSHFSARSGGGAHIGGCIYDRSNKNSVWKGVATKNPSIVDIDKIIKALEKVSANKKSSEKEEPIKEESKKELILKKEFLFAFVPSEYKEVGTCQLKENFEIKTKWIDGKLSTMIFDKENPKKDVWSKTISEEEIKETLEEVKKEQKKKTTREHDQINKNIFQLYLLAITADEDTTFLGEKRVFDCCLNCLTYRDFRIGKNELKGSGLFIGRRFNFTQEWILNPVQEQCKQRNIHNYVLLNDAFVPKETSQGQQRAEELPVVAVLDCSTSMVKSKILDKIKSGSYFAVGCNWETVDLLSIDGNMRKIAIGHICSEKQLEVLKGELNLEENNSLAW